MSKYALIGLVALVTSTGLHAQAGCVVEPRCKHIFTKTGVPVMQGDTAQDGEHVLLCRKGYAACLNTGTKNPDWVAQVVTARGIRGNAVRRNNFTADDEAPPPESATLKDYRRSGFDRGHQAPAADFKRTQKLMDESFFMTNMAPQIGPCFNRGVWRLLERDVRNLAKTRKRLIVFTGPVYDSPVKTIGDFRKEKHGVDLAVPDSFYKIVYHPATHRAVAFLIPNKTLCSRAPSEFITNIHHIEELSGVDFFPDFSHRDRNILKKSEGNLWGW